MESAIRGHDQVEIVKDGDLELLVHMKWVTQANPPFYLLVLEKPEPSRHLVLWALKAYPALCDGLESLTPLQIVRQVAERFGDTVKVGEKVGKFILHETLVVDDPMNARLVEMLGPMDHSVMMSMFVRPETGERPCIKVALGFCLNMAAYVRWCQGQSESKR